MSSVPVPSTSSLTSTGNNLLIVDDTPANLRLLSEILNEEGYNVRTVRNAQSALRAITSYLPDLILLDIMMPGIDGYELCCILKENPQTQAIPIIFISALDRPEDKVKAFEVGGTDYIPKPFHHLEVLARVRHHLQLRLTQIALESSEQRFRTIFEQASIGICVTQPDGQIVETNAAFQGFLGHSATALAQQREQDFLHPEDLAAGPEPDAAVGLSCHETRYRHATGEWVWGRVTRCAAQSPEGQLLFTFSMVENIQARKQVEAALEASEHEMRTVFTAMSDLVLVIRPARAEIQVMPTRYLEHMASDRDAILNRLLSQLLGDTADPALTETIQTVLTTGAAATLDYQIQTDDQTRWFSANVSALSAEAVIWVARDISDRVKAEHNLQVLAAELEQRVARRTAQLQEANTRLRQEMQERLTAESRLAMSEVRFRLAVDNMPALFVIYDADLRYQFVNQRSGQILPGSREDMIGRRDCELFPTAITQEYLPLLEETLRTHSLQSAECYIFAPEQGVSILDITYVPLMNSAGQVDQILGIAHDITQRKQAERELLDAKEQLQAVLDAVPGFVSWIGMTYGPDWSPQFYYRGANQKLLDALDIVPENFVGQPLGFLHGDGDFEQFIAHLFASDQRHTQSAVMKLPYQGHNRSFLVVAQKYQQGMAVVSVGIDITERIAMEQQLQLSYEQLQLLSELTLKIRQSLDLDEILQTAVWELHNFLRADRVAVVQYPRPDRAVIVQEAITDPWQVLPSEQFPVTSQQWQDQQLNAFTARSTAQLSESERRFYEAYSIQSQLMVPIFVQRTLWGAVMVHQCASERTWQLHETALLLALGDQLGIAITQAQLLNHLEERVAERTAELLASEKQLQRIIHSSTYGIIICDQEGTIQFANPSAVALFGRSPDELIGFELGVPISTDESTEISLLRPRERPRIAEFRSVAIRWGGAPAYLISLMDITERKLIEQMKDEFLAIASHELRTPLTSIRGALGLLATGKLGTFTPSGQQMIEIAVNNTERLSRLLNDILDLERITSGRVLPEKRRVDGVELMIQAAQVMEAMAVEHHIQLQLEANHQTLPHLHAEPAAEQPSSLVPQIAIWADTDQILQTLTNLISNAIKFSQSHQIVTIGLVAGEEEALFYVRDRGRGIPANKLETIFARFQQVDASDSREKGGTGLGLAICREIVLHHGGQIWVESELGVGSTFFFLLPHKTSET